MTESTGSTLKVTLSLPGAVVVQEHKLVPPHKFDEAMELLAFRSFIIVPWDLEEYFAIAPELVWSVCHAGKDVAQYFADHPCNNPLSDEDNL